MPRGPRLDAAGVLHHVMVRGIERRAIFRDDRDRADLVHRAAALAQAGAWSVLAWALLPNQGSPVALARPKCGIGHEERYGVARGRR